MSVKEQLESILWYHQQERAKDVPGHVAGCIDLPPEKAKMLYALLYELLENQTNKDDRKTEE